MSDMSDPDPGATVQAVTLDCGQDWQLRWIWFLPYRKEPGRLVRIPSLIPDLGEYMRYWRSVWRREGALKHQSQQPLFPPERAETRGRGK